MKQLLNEYYFENIPNELESLFNENKYTYEVLNNLKEFIANKTNGQVIIGNNVKMHDFVSIEGPAIIGNNVEIHSHAYIRPNTIICDNTVIGHSAVLKECIIMPGAKVQNFSFVGNSIIGSSARIGSGTIATNRKLDQSQTGIKINGEYECFNTDFFGIVLGDNSRIGANCVTMPGTHIGPMTLVGPMSKVKGFIPRLKIYDDGNIVDGKEYKLK